MERPILSICIPVYNQKELVYELVSSILKYEYNDIEIVISDDCSTENIEEMINDFRDERIRYYRNNTNVGHDLNIINAFKNSKASFAFLLRTRDGVVVDGLKTIINVIKENSDLSYITGGAIDEDGKWRIHYAETKKINGLDNCLRTHFSLYVHPSGSIYNVDKLDLVAIESFIKDNINTKYSFVSHSLFREYLALYGSFLILKEATWVYVHTERSKDLAVNKISKGVSVYSSDLIIKRYSAELKWLLKILDFDNSKIQTMFDMLFKNYLYQITWGQKRRNSNPGILKHYQMKPLRTNAVKDTRNLINVSYECIDKSSNNDVFWGNLEKVIKKRVFINFTYGFARYFAACVLDFLNLKNTIDRWRANREIKY